MFKRKLLKALEEARRQREINIKNGSNRYHSEYFVGLYSLHLENLANAKFKKHKYKLFSKYFEQIFPFIIASNTYILRFNIDFLIEEPEFKEKFKNSLKNYPYKTHIYDLLKLFLCLSREHPDKYNDLIDNELLTWLASLNCIKDVPASFINTLNEKKQLFFLKQLSQYKRVIPYFAIEFKGNNKEYIYDNIDYFTSNSPNLYSLMNFVSENQSSQKKVSQYIDSHEEQAFDSLFYEINRNYSINNPHIKEIIKMLISELMEYEKIPFSKIKLNNGAFSKVLIIGNKVIKVGKRVTKSFPNNPYIITPLLRQEVKVGNNSCFVEITERVEADIKVSNEELYQLYKNIRNLGLIWTDIHADNVGRLIRDNIIHWSDDIKPSDETLELGKKRGNKILRKGELVLLDADFIFNENDPDIYYSNYEDICYKFEQRYLKEKKSPQTDDTIYTNSLSQDTLEGESIHHR